MRIPIPTAKEEKPVATSRYGGSSLGSSLKRSSLETKCDVHCARLASAGRSAGQWPGARTLSQTPSVLRISQVRIPGHEARSGGSLIGVMGRSFIRRTEDGHVPALGGEQGEERSEGTCRQFRM